MAVPDPTLVPVLLAVPAPVEPTVAVEAGITTSEWKLALGFLIQLAVAGTGLIAARIGLHLDDATIAYVSGLEVAGAGLAASYVIGRSIRKKGTP